MTTNDPHNQPNRQTITWPEFDDAVQDVTDKICQQRNRNQLTNDMLIGIQMGGLPLMTAVVNRLKDKYNYKIDNMQLATTSAYRPCVKALAEQFNNHIDTGNNQSRIWLFEDITDTGSTIDNLISRLITVGKCNIDPSRITVVTIVDRTQHGYIINNPLGLTDYQSVSKYFASIIAGFKLPFDSATFIQFPWEVNQ